MTAATILTVFLLVWAASDMVNADTPADRTDRHTSTTPSRSESSPPAKTSPSPTTSSPATSPTKSPGKSPAQGALPEGYHWHHDRTDFSIAVPDGWSATHHGHYLYVEDPHSSRLLIVDQTDTPKSDPLADWRKQEAARRSGYSGYHRVRLESVDYPQARKTADWEFTYNGSDGRTHVLNRNILVNGKHAYALYWSTPANRWKPSQPIFDAFATTFQPATD
jgi:eukaryotic-like serine/threonine-protein kinase